MIHTDFTPPLLARFRRIRQLDFPLDASPPLSQQSPPQMIARVTLEIALRREFDYRIPR